MSGGQQIQLPKIMSLEWPSALEWPIRNFFLDACGGATLPKNPNAPAIFRFGVNNCIQLHVIYHNPFNMYFSTSRYVFKRIGLGQLSPVWCFLLWKSWSLWPMQNNGAILTSYKTTSKRNVSLFRNQSMDIKKKFTSPHHFIILNNKLLSVSEYPPGN